MSIVYPIARSIVAPIASSIGGGGATPPAETFNIVDQDDNALVDQNGNNIVWSS